MNGMNGIALAGMFHERFPAIRVLMLSMHDNLEYVTQAVRAGAERLCAQGFARHRNHPGDRRGARGPDVFQRRARARD